MSVEIMPVSLEQAESYRACLESVAQERQPIAMLEAPPLYLIRAYLNGLSFRLWSRIKPHSSFISSLALYRKGACASVSL